jgi:hypothetical protein
MVHHTASTDHPTVDREAIRRYHVENRLWQDVGYHWLVEAVDPLVYAAIPGRPMTIEGSHCRGPRNGDSIGVAFVGNFMELPPPPAQLEAGAVLIAGLLELIYPDWARRWPTAGDPIPDRVLLHRSHGITDCPGDAFPIDGLRRMVRILLEG